MRSYLFVLSPSIAIYNQWKDILVEIRKNGDNVDMFLPKPRTYENMLPSLYLIQKEIQIKNFIVQVNPLNPYSLKRLNIKDIKFLINKRSFKFQNNIRFLLVRIVHKIKFEYFRTVLGNCIRYISSINSLKRFSRRCFIKNKYDFLLYDVFEERKVYITPFLSFFYTLYRVGLFHGNGISSTHFKNFPIWTPKDKLLIMDFTGLNKSLYCWSLSIKNFDYQIIGIPSHAYNKDKLLKGKKFNQSELKNKLNLGENINFITLTSRPDDNTYCNSNDRKSYLKLIGKFLINSGKWHLLIKAHPKEEAYSKFSWANLLGLDSESNYFSITKKNPLELASISEFGFSFVSHCCIDFACFGKPMIELRSVEKSKHGDITSFFDNDGQPLTAEASKKLSFSIKNKSELSLFLNEADKKIKYLTLDSEKAYKYCYGENQYKPGMFIKLVDYKVNQNSN